MSGAQACVATPVSWLALEQLAAAGLAPAETATALAHLAACPACRACMDHIRADAARKLPALPAPLARPAWRWPVWVGAGVAVGAAAALLWAIAGGDGAGRRAPTHLARTAIKGGGGTLVLDLVRERAGSIAHEPTVFAAEDRFKVVITCAPAIEVEVSVAIYQNGERFFPLAAQQLVCGNRVAMAGAFRLTGATPALVCAQAGAPDDRKRGTPLPWPAAAPPADAACVRLAPAPTRAPAPSSAPASARELGGR
jgi:hypothetical protein